MYPTRPCLQDRISPFTAARDVALLTCRQMWTLHHPCAHLPPPPPDCPSWSQLARTCFTVYEANCSKNSPLVARHQAKDAMGAFSPRLDEALTVNHALFLSIINIKG